MSVLDHKQQASNSISCLILTISDTRTWESDKSGQLIERLLLAEGHTVIDRLIVQDDQECILGAVRLATENERIQSIILNGGTGIAKRDVTIEAVESLFDKRLPGFGELFRLLSFQEQIGSAAFMSRATAGVYQNRPIYALPGSIGAVRLGMERLILPELAHAVYEVTK